MFFESQVALFLPPFLKSHIPYCSQPNQKKNNGGQEICTMECIFKRKKCVFLPNFEYEFGSLELMTIYLNANQPFHDGSVAFLPNDKHSLDIPKP